MDCPYAYYERNRCDRFLTYVGHGDNFLLAGFCIRISPDLKATSIFNGVVSIEADYKLGGKDIVVYIDGKIHSNLYSDSFIIFDGYGRLIPQLRLNGTCLHFEEETYSIHTSTMTDTQTYENNIRERNPSNVYGPIPNMQVEIQETETDYTILGAVSGLDKKLIAALYTNPMTIKKQIENDVVLSTLCI